jgi:hypothetical protein
MTMLHHTTTPTRAHRWFTDLRSSLRARREARAARRRLRDDLASYRTPAEVDELFAAIDRTEDSASAAEVRGLFLAQLGTRQHRYV